MTRGVALFLTVVTGFSGLVYEVTWQKGLAILLGSHSEATAAVLAIFLGGLSLGYSVFGRICHRHVSAAAEAGRPTRLLLLYGIVEAGIGAWAIAFPALFEGVRALSVALTVPSDAVAFGIDVVWTALLIGPPTVLMGGTIPILTQALSRDLEDATRLHAWVYGFNTAGAFIGAFVAGFFLVPALGIPGTLRTMGLVNLVVGAAFVLLHRREEAGATSPEAPGDARIRGFGSYAAVALLLGFAMMAIQTVLIRIGGLAFGASHFTFAIVVACYVLCIALGSLAVSTLHRIPRWFVVGCPLLLGVLLALLYPVIQYAPYGAHLVRVLFTNIPQAFYPYYLVASFCILVILAVPLGLSGASVPLLFHDLRRQMGELGSLAGRLYAWNTVGNLLGALLGGYFLLHWLDLHHVYRLGVAAVLLAGGLLLVRVTGVARPVAGIVVAAAWLGLFVLPRWEPEQLSSGHFRRREAHPASFQGPAALLGAGYVRKILFDDDDPVQTVAVKDHVAAGGKVSRAIFNNGKPDGSLVPDYPTMALAGLVSCLHVVPCERAFVIGFGTGVTAGELGSLDEVESVEVVEISQGVIDAAPFFETGNRNVLANRKIEISRTDAYRALLRSEQDFSVIVSEPSNPWVTGVEMLYSKEFLTAARDRLVPGGVFAQWTHTYEMDPPTLELVLRTYASVFEQVGVWFLFGPDMLLLGFPDPDRTPDFATLGARAGQRDFRAGLRRAGVASWHELIGHELLPPGILGRDDLPGPLHTLLHPRLTHQAARAFFLGGRAYVPRFHSDEAVRRGREDSLFARLERSGALDAAAWTDLVKGVCESRSQDCATLYAAWRHREPDSPVREELVARMRSRGRMAEHLSEARLSQLASLYADGPEGPISAGRANELTALYGEYYHHALPFRKEALESTWARCRGAACERGRRSAERILGAAAPAGTPRAR
ncbi:MAG: hypothetical protein HKP30_08960 [Myxococcales bacterium]|nr:hypothetical protein [Myxococcales bacterium]